MSVELDAFAVVAIAAVRNRLLRRLKRVQANDSVDLPRIYLMMHTDAAFAHNLARKGTPNLYLAANFLEPDDKFRAFLATYAAMRLVDDLADDARAAGEIPLATKRVISAELDRFADMFRLQQIDDKLPYAADLKLALVRFQIPDWPFTLLADAMKFDLTNDRFDTLDQFLKYSEGAAVSPAAIFMHLAASAFDDTGQLQLPPFDVRDAARPLAIFSYIVHILRDFKKDFHAGARPLIYIDLETSDMFYVSEEEMARTVVSGQQSLKFTKMVKWYFNRLTWFQVRARLTLDHLADQLPDDGRFALDFIYELYSATAAKIAECQYRIAGDEINLPAREIYRAAGLAAARSGVPDQQIRQRLEKLLSSA
jgi:phytoene/squalene synthetase